MGGRLDEEGGGGGVLRLSGGMMGVLSCGRKNATGISKKSNALA